MKRFLAILSALILSGAALTLLLAGLLDRSPVARADNGVTINEIRIDQPSSDYDEYFELAGSSGTSLDDLTYLVIGDISANFSFR